MDKNKTEDWRIIAHEEFESRKSLEHKLSRISSEYKDTKQALDATHKYNAIIAQKLSELERNNFLHHNKLKKSVELLKKSKTLLANQKQTINDLTAKNQELNDVITKKDALLQAETLQHQKTSEQLSQALTKLAYLIAEYKFSELQKQNKSSQNSESETILLEHTDFAEVDDAEIIDETLSNYDELNQKAANFIQKILKKRSSKDDFMQQVINFAKSFNIDDKDEDLYGQDNE